MTEMQLGDRPVRHVVNANIISPKAITRLPSGTNRGVAAFVIGFAIIEATVLVWMLFERR